MSNEFWMALAFCVGSVFGVIVMACAKVSGACERCAECREGSEREAPPPFDADGFARALAAEPEYWRQEQEQLGHVLRHICGDDVAITKVNHE